MVELGTPEFTKLTKLQGGLEQDLFEQGTPELS